MARFVRYRMDLPRRARALRRDPTPGERKLWYEFLRNLPEKFTRQKPLGSYIADFYCSSRRLVIEIDGDSHFDAEAERYDAARTASLRALGVRVVRFTNRDLIEAFEGVCAEIRKALDAS
jgi:very-short-patch-repair endonuclease